MKIELLILTGVVLGLLARPSESQCAGTAIVPSDGFFGDSFGHASLQGDTLLAAAQFALDANNLPTGAVYVFQRDDQGTPDTTDDVWVETAKLLPSDGQAGDWFGSYVQLTGTTALIGAHGRPGGGQVYFFERYDGGTPAEPFDDNWIEVQRFGGSRPVTSIGSRDGFGCDISVSGTTALIGARDDGELGHQAGAAYVFERLDNGTPADPFDDSWVEIQKLLPSDGTTLDVFGPYLELDGNTALITAPMDDDIAPGSGSVYVFGRDDNGTPADPMDDAWVEIQKLHAGGAAFEDAFGVEIELQDELVVIGAPQVRQPGNGKVCVFHHDDNGTPADPFDDAWNEIAQFGASDGSPGDVFGYDLSVSGDRVLIGALSDDDRGANSGAAYLYQRSRRGTPDDPSDDFWTLFEKYVLVGGESEDYFGRWVELDGSNAMIQSGGWYGFLTGPGKLWHFDVDADCTPYAAPRLGLGVNQADLASVTPPRMNAEWRLEIQTTVHTNPILTFLIAKPRPLSPGQMVAQGELLIDLTQGTFLKSWTLSNPTGTDVFVYQVPVAVSIQGLQMFLQGAVLGHGQGWLTNALDVVIGQ
jgi:hypothetical protein